MADLTKEPKGPEGAVEDRGGLLDAGGPKAHGQDIKTGQLSPGPAGQPIGGDGQFPKVYGMEDRYELPVTGGPKRFDVPRTTVGELLKRNAQGRSGAVVDVLELESSGGRDYHTSVPVGAGLLQRPSPGAVEDLLYFKLQADGLPLDWGDVTPTGTGPRVVGAIGGGGSGLPGACVRVTFNGPMRLHPYLGGLGTPQNYLITHVLSGRRLYVQKVVIVNATTVDLYTEEFLPFNNVGYEVQVKNVEGEDGDVIDPLYDSASFGARGTDFPAGTELHVFAGLYTGFQSDNASGVDPDVSPPELQSLDPADGAAIVAKESNVFIKIKDLESNINQGSVRIDIERGAGWETVWILDAPQPGFPTTKVVIGADEITYDINPSIDFNESITVQVRVRCQDTATIPNALDRTYEFDIFDPYGFMTVTHTADQELTVTFIQAMETVGAPGVALNDPLSYEFLSLSGLGLPGPGFFYATAVNVISPTLIKLTIPYTTAGEDFRLRIVGALETATGSLITGALFNWTSVTSLPRVSSIEMLDARTMTVTFNREMDDNGDLVNPSAYSFTGSIRAEIVQRTAPNAVKVILNRATNPGEYYLLSVKANP
jgi:hypothetical protein